MDRDATLAHLKLVGNVPFSAELIPLRGVSDPDASSQTKKGLHRAMAMAYHLGNELALADLEQIAERWRPYWSWVGLLLLRSTVSR